MPELAVFNIHCKESAFSHSFGFEPEPKPKPKPTLGQTTPILHDRGCYHDFLSEKLNCKSSGIDLTAIEVYSLIIRPSKCLKKN